MALPVKVVDINTATLPDHKNVLLLGSQRKELASLFDDDGTTFYALGDTKEYVGMSHLFSIGLFPQAVVFFNLQRVGSPTFSIRCRVYKDNGSDAPDFNQLVSSSFPLLASTIPTAKSGT